MIGSSRYHEHVPDESEIEIGWTFLARSHWAGASNREVKRMMLDHAFAFVDTVVFWVGETNWRSQGAMTKIGGIKREGLFTRALSGDRPYFIFGITKARYEAERCWPDYAASGVVCRERIVMAVRGQGASALLVIF